MDFKRVLLPRGMHVGPGVIEDTAAICMDLRIKGKFLVVTGPHTLKIGGEKVMESLGREGFEVEHTTIRHPSLEVVQEVVDQLEGVSAVLGVGGGKVIDVAKLASTRCNLDFISVPTAASHDGIASPRASIKNEEGSVSIEAAPPMGIIADTSIIGQAPFRLLAAGFGDIISNQTAVLDWKLAHRLLNEYYSDSAAALSLVTAEVTTKMADAVKEGHVESAALVVKGLISSGMAISIAGSSRPASGAEHKFSHALDLIAPQPALHGEQCAVGTIMMMYLHGGDWELVRDTLKAIKAPTTARELDIKPEYIVEALSTAHTIRRERYTILGDRGLTYQAAEKLALHTGVIES